MRLRKKMDQNSIPDEEEEFLDEAIDELDLDD